jgi:hypothetical protein
MKNIGSVPSCYIFDFGVTVKLTSQNEIGLLPLLFSESLYKIGIISQVEFITEAIWTWSFLFGKAFNYSNLVYLFLYEQTLIVYVS